MPKLVDSCLNCRWARWEMTKGKLPRINRNRAGQCTYTVKPPPVPAIYRLLNFKPELTLNHHQRMGLWADDAYTDCPCWEAKTS